ncbi:SGNH/GDSL hydrolase family protein [Paraburkholderia sp.]|uniref:SGNH/GDSL hydrolase family protein n=1 Tax=Paraburkholderia sp. TaxID=1926495 RepID=UPI0023A61A25|nr:SGNH/GDSL hydrolase family protein [Paraburkholderia sp.]MDE1179504.1 SGNH/GDSL hydrolase family protein [Paraburkholderia sp.]
MKHAEKNLSGRTLLRAGQCAIACAAFALITACGGGSDNNNSSANTTPAGGVKLQVVSFGDSLSDVGTYSPVILTNFGGGKFTTNPGEIWVQKVAEYYGGTVTPAYLGGFGQPLAAAGGLGYAQGGARVNEPLGEGHADASVANAAYAQATTVPVLQQIQNYIDAHGSFNSNQLVLINGGANDIFIQAQAISDAGTAAATAAAQGGADATTAANAGIAASVAAIPAASQAITTAATQFIGAVQNLIAHGATHVVVMNIPDIVQSPLGVNSSASAKQVLGALTTGYNNALKQVFGSSSQVILIDAAQLEDDTLANYQALGFTVSNTGTACNLASMEAAAAKYGESDPSAFASSLFCSPETYTVAGADQTYMFADLVHPTTHLHALFAQYVEQKIAATGLGK